MTRLVSVLALHSFYDFGLCFKRRPGFGVDIQRALAYCELFGSDMDQY
jgi:hypothetical protein